MKETDAHHCAQPSIALFREHRGQKWGSPFRLQDLSDVVKTLLTQCHGEYCNQFG